MKIKRENGIAGLDIIIAIMAIMLFSTLIFSMMYNNVTENVKLKKETLAMIYMTEILEKIGICEYENSAYSVIGEEFTHITQKNDFVSQEILDKYKVEMAETSNFEGIEEKENICKKIKVKISYEVSDKMYSCSMERIKIKE